VDFPIDFPNYDLQLPSFESDDKMPVMESIPTDPMARVQPPIKCEPVPGKICPEVFNDDNYEYKTQYIMTERVKEVQYM
jgi:hypothetical protein